MSWSVIIILAWLFSIMIPSELVLMPLVASFAVIVTYQRIDLRKCISENQSSVIKQSSIMLAILMIFLISTIGYTNLQFEYNTNEYNVLLNFSINTTFLSFGIWLLLFSTKKIQQLIYMWLITFFGSLITVIGIAQLYDYSVEILIYHFYLLFGTLSLLLVTCLDVNKNKLNQRLVLVIVPILVSVIGLYMIQGVYAIKLMVSVLLMFEIVIVFVLKKHGK